MWREFNVNLRLAHVLQTEFMYLRCTRKWMVQTTTAHRIVSLCGQCASDEIILGHFSAALPPTGIRWTMIFETDIKLVIKRLMAKECSRQSAECQYVHCVWLQTRIHCTISGRKQTMAPCATTEPPGFDRNDSKSRIHTKTKNKTKNHKSKSIIFAFW